MTRKFVRITGDPGLANDPVNLITPPESYRCPQAQELQAFMTTDPLTGTNYGHMMRVINDTDYRLDVIETLLPGYLTAHLTGAEIKAILETDLGIPIPLNVDMVDGFHASDLIGIATPLMLPKGMWEIVGDHLILPAEPVSPVDICYDSAGHVYVTSTEVNPAKVYKIELESGLVVATFSFDAPLPITMKSNCLCFDGEVLLIGFADTAFDMYNVHPAVVGYYAVIQVDGTVVQTPTVLPNGAWNPTVALKLDNSGWFVMAGCGAVTAGFGWALRIDPATYALGAIAQTAVNYGTIVAGAVGGCLYDQNNFFVGGTINYGQAHCVILGSSDDGMGSQVAMFLLEFCPSAAGGVFVVRGDAGVELLDQGIGGTVNAHLYPKDICYASERYWIVSADNSAHANGNLLSVDPQEMETAALAGRLLYAAHVADWMVASTDVPYSVCWDGGMNLFCGMWDTVGPPGDVHIAKMGIIQTAIGVWTALMKGDVYQNLAGYHPHCICMTHKGVYMIEEAPVNPPGQRITSVWG